MSSSALTLERCDYLSSLDSELLLRLWPKDHIMLGFRVSRYIQTVLVKAPQICIHTSLKHGRARILDVQCCLQRLSGGVDIVVHSSSRTLGSVLAGLLVATRNGWTSLHSLNLSDNCAGCVETKLLSEALPMCKRFEHLNLSNNDLRDEGIRLLVRALPQCKFLLHLDLRSNFIGDKGAVFLSRAILTASALTVLLLGDNNIGNMGAQHLAECIPGCSSLIRLDLSSNDVRCSGIGGNLLLSSLHSLTHVEDLNLSNNQIRSAGAETLSGALHSLPMLAKLDLSYTMLGLHGSVVLSRAFQHSKALSFLDLSGNRMSNGGARLLILSLPVLHRLTSCNLSNNGLGDSSADLLSVVLPQCKLLEELDISRNLTSLDSAKQLLNALPDCPSMSALSLERNVMGCVAAETLQEAFTDFEILRQINLSRAPPNARIAELLATLLPSCLALEHLVLASCTLSTPGIATLAQSLPLARSLAHIDVSGNALSDDGITPLVMVLHRCSTLTLLDLSENRATCITARILSGQLPACSSLLHLLLQDNLLTEDGARSLYTAAPTCPSLQSLDLTGNPFEVFAAPSHALGEASTTAMGLAASRWTRRLFELEQLDCTTGNVMQPAQPSPSDRADRKFGKQAADADQVAFQFVGAGRSGRHLGPQTASDSESIPQLEHHDQGPNALARLQAANLAQEPRHPDHKISSASACAAATAGTDNSPAMLSNGEGGDLAVNSDTPPLTQPELPTRPLFFPLPASPPPPPRTTAKMPWRVKGAPLTRLDLSRNALVEQDTLALLSVARRCRCITHLDLSHNLQSGCGGGRAVASFLAHAPLLSTLNLGWNTLGPRGGRAIAPSLPLCPGLTAMDLTGNKIGNLGLVRVCEALTFCRGLTELQLAHNRITAEGVGALAQLLGGGREGLVGLRELDLDSNSLYVAGATKLAEAMVAGGAVALMRLRCCDNRIGSAGGEAVARSLRHCCPQLTELDLRDNVIDPQVAAALVRAGRRKEPAVAVLLSGPDGIGGPASLGFA